MGALIAVAAIAVFLLILRAASVRVAREYERGIVFRLGRLLPEPKGPGLFILIPIVDRMIKVDLRTITLTIPPQEVITKDNVSVTVDAVIYYRISDPVKATFEVQNFAYAATTLAQTNLRNLIGDKSLDETLTARGGQKDALPRQRGR